MRSESFVIISYELTPYRWLAAHLLSQRLCSIWCLRVSPPRRFLFLCSSAKRSAQRAAGAPIVSLEKVPEASVEEMHWVGACRLKYLQRRHAAASFIRCLARQTRKLSAVLNQSQILFFIWHSPIYFAPSSSSSSSIVFFKGIMSRFEIAHILTSRFTRFLNWKK